VLDFADGIIGGDANALQTEPNEIIAISNAALTLNSRRSLIMLDE